MQRSGVTLTEVLVAIFIMGIGLLSLLALFPLGALNMAQAIKDERVTMASQNATALARLNFNSSTPQATYPLAGDSFLANQYRNPGAAWATIPGSSILSYPNYVDPLGRSVLNSSQIGNLLGLSPGFPRSTVSFITNQAQVTRYLTVLDDITFTENGVAEIPPGGQQISREGRYSWAYFIRAKPSANPPQDGADISVVMYERRSLAAAASSANGPPDESVYRADFGTVSSGGSANTATIKNAAAAPIKKGTWILDATISPLPPNVPTAIGGFFYRVVGVTPDPTNANDVVVELQTPVQQQYPIGTGVAVVMEGVVEVFKAP